MDSWHSKIFLHQNERINPEPEHSEHSSVTIPKHKQVIGAKENKLFLFHYHERRRQLHQSHLKATRQRLEKHFSTWNSRHVSASLLALR